ncbi:MAG: hypothetical protein ACRDUX_07765 [Mycobacterium sp.]
MLSVSRSTATIAVVAGLLTVGDAAAAAEPADVPTAPVVTQLTERPEVGGATPFTDNPAIVDSRLQAMDSWSRLPDESAIAVHFTSGTPACYGVHTEVQETADIVAVKLRAGTLPGGQRVCTMIAVPGTLAVGLQAPVGNRAVVSIT